MNEPAPFERVLLVGCGLIGGSLGLAIRVVWPDVSVSVMDPAADPRVKDHFTLASSPAVARDVDLVVLGAPVAENLRLLDAFAPHVGAATVVTDLGSTKAAMVDRARRHRSMAFLGGHPMAGGTHSGFAHADAGLFLGRPWILTPDPESARGPLAEGEALARLTQMVVGIGARPVVMGADEHDRVMAYVSHLPQVVSSTLMAVTGKAVTTDGLQFAGPGLADTTRLAGSTPALWLDILATNAAHVGQALDALHAALPTSEMLYGDAGAMQPVLQDGRRWRTAFDGQRPPASSPRMLHRPAVRTFLEMTSPSQVVRCEFPDVDATVRRLDHVPGSLYRYLYREVGRPWHWVDRWDWSDARVAEHLASGGIEIWLLSVSGTPAGYFELHRTAQEVEICYFGLLPEFTGQRLGPALLSLAADEAWRSAPVRVWLHTCSLDHPAALRNYKRVGFTPYREEQYDAKIPVGRPL
ncbi:MAG: prephenate dehydrogenase/arogenate dehydrogenase family protein [Acidobacteria bacterium]|nr:prephenate dehydrogenase/arogenate dehydrogenase family protein [Acidobacteriota bacterium]